MRIGFLSTLTLVGSIFASLPAFACGFSPSESTELRHSMHGEDRAAIQNGDAVIEAMLVYREGDRFDMLFYDFEPTVAVSGSAPTQILQSRRSLASSCGPLPYLYLDWDDGALVGAPVVLLLRTHESGVLQVVQAARYDTLDGQNMLKAARSWPTGN